MDGGGEGDCVEFAGFDEGGGRGGRVDALVTFHVRARSGEAAQGREVDAGEVGGVVGHVPVDAGLRFRGGLFVWHEDVFEGGSQKRDFIPRSMLG